jgi:hypothetical protein
MGVEAEHCGAFDGFVTTHAFEDAATVVQRVRRHVRIGFPPGDNLAVPPYPSGLIECHCRDLFCLLTALRLWIFSRLRVKSSRALVLAKALSKTERREENN